EARRAIVDLHELLTDIAADARFEATTKGGSVRLGRLDAASTTGEPELLRSAIENVVRNAVRYTREGTDVEVSLESNAAGEAVIEVRDHGPGVPADELEKIFNPFYRVDDVRERHTGGAGLGLAIARRTVERYGGHIEARPAVGGGLRVTITLPLDG